MPDPQTSSAPALPSARSAPRPLLSRLAEMQWALTGLGLALLVLLVLPSAQIKLGASQLNGLVGSYTSGGHLWQVSYSSTGTTTWHTIGPDGKALAGSRSWPATGSSDGFQESTRLDGTTSGTVTAKLTWVPYTGQDNTTDPPSSTVIVTEGGNAQFGGGGVGTGNANDGWSDPVQYNASSGTHYEVKDGSSGSITITKTVSASTPPNTTPNAYGGFDRIGAFVVASLSVSGDSVTINPGSAVKDSNGTYNILVGQGCTASLNTPPFSVQQQSGWTWTVSGITFQDWQPTSPNNPDASYYVGGSGPLTNSTAHWFWNDPGPTPTNETVTCTATVTPPDGKTAPFQVSVTQKVKVYVPSYNAHGIGGYMQVNSSYPGASGPELWAGPTAAMTANNQPGGMYWEASVFTPPQPAFGAGRLALVQIAKPNSSYRNLTPPVQNHPNPNNGMTGLDGTFPYGDVVPEAQEPLKDDDNPDIHLVGLGPMGGVVAGSATFSSSYTDYLMYRPPGSDDNTRWIALAQFSWNTNGNATIPDPNNPNSWTPYVTQNTPPDKAGTVFPSTWTSFTGVMGPAFVLSWTSVVRPPKPF